MNALLNYLLEASFGLFVFYIVYYLLLRKETNFHFVRIYLLIALVVSTLIPLITLPSFGNVSTLPSLDDAVSTYWLPEIVVGNALVKNEGTINIWQAILMLYAVGILFLLARLIIQLSSLVHYLGSVKARLFENTYVLEVDDDKPTFSFFNFIIIGQSKLLSEDDKQAILTHERIHSARYHSIDMLLTNFLTILFWFNPLIYLYKKTLVQVHEFEADSRAVVNHDVDQYCGLLAKVALHSAEFPIANHFNNSLTLKRIAMLKNVKHTLANWKKALLLPIGLLVFFVIACDDQIVSDMQSVAKQSSIVTEYPTEVHTTINQIKLKNSNAEVQVIGVMEGDKTAIENLDKKLKVSEIRTVHVIKPKQKGSNDYDSYIVIEKGSSLDRVAALSAEDGEVFTVVEETAQPVGGMTALYELISTKLRYPEEALKKGIEGKVFVQFIVNESGALSDFTVLKGIGSGCDEAAVRALSASPNWTPGKQAGKVVKQRMVLPITFAI